MTPGETILYLHNMISGGASICTDSRNTANGSIFFALKGESFDGNAFAQQALDNGCRLAVIDNPGLLTDERCLLVENVLLTLQQISTYHRSLFQIPVIGITGSNGKTTTKELCHAVLSSGMNICATSGNLNNHIGVPLTLLSFKEPLDLAIVEMGANHLNEIASLCELAKPQYGLITNIGKAHLEGFGSYNNITRAKSELFRYVESVDGTVFVNGDDPLLMKQSDHISRVLYGQSNFCHCSGIITDNDPFLCLKFMVNQSFGKARQGMSASIRSRLAGAYNFDNIMAAVTVGLYFGIPPEAISEAIASYIPQNNRSQLSETRLNTVLIDAYNANPSSMYHAISHFHSFKSKGKTAVILGDMLELGKTSEEEHRNIYHLVCDYGFDLKIFVGQEFTKVVKTSANTMVFLHTDEAAGWLQANPVRHYHILLKGSRGIKMESLLQYL